MLCYQMHIPRVGASRFWRAYAKHSFEKLNNERVLTHWVAINLSMIAGYS